MHHSLLGYVIAMAMGGVSLVLQHAFPDLHELRSGLLWLAFAIALLATLGFAHDKGWLSGAVYLLRRPRLRVPLERAEMKSFDDVTRSQAAPHVRAPRPAGPAGPVPVLERQPKDAIGDVIETTGAPTVRKPKLPSED